MVKTVQFKDPKYVGDPVNAVRIFNEKEVDELVFLDITATIEGREPQYDVIREIAGECFMPMSYGGGITNVEQIRRILNSGVEKVIVNTSAFKKPGLLRAASERFGSQSVVASIDVKKNWRGGYEVFTRSGTVKESMPPVDWAQTVEAEGAGEIILNSIDRDGAMKGYDSKLISLISHTVKIPVVAVGGAGTMRHFAEAILAGASAVSAGSMFVFYGPHRAVLISYPNSLDVRNLAKISK